VGKLHPGFSLTLFRFWHPRSWPSLQLEQPKTPHLCEKRSQLGHRLAGRFEKGENLLLVKSIVLAFLKLTKENGKSLVKLLFCSSRTSKLFNVPKVHGSWPESLFPDNDRNESLSRFIMFADNDPSKKFLLKSTKVKFLNENNSSGRPPIKKLVPRSRTRS
jgi:hypothetical protein